MLLQEQVIKMENVQKDLRNKTASMSEDDNLINIFFTKAFSRAYSKPSQTSKLKLFLEKTKSSIL